MCWLNYFVVNAVFRSSQYFALSVRPS